MQLMRLTTTVYSKLTQNTTTTILLDFSHYKPM